MIKQTKQIKTNLKSYYGNVGLGFLSVATILGMLRMPTHTANRYVLPGQVARVEQSSSNNPNSPIRIEKEDTNPAYISYSETQRTAPRSGKY